jgi:hypothetical protein
LKVVKSFRSTVCEVKRKILFAGKKLSFLNYSGIIEEEEEDGEEKIDSRSIFDTFNVSGSATSVIISTASIISLSYRVV